MTRKNLVSIAAMAAAIALNGTSVIADRTESKAYGKGLKDQAG